MNKMNFVIDETSRATLDEICEATGHSMGIVINRLIQNFGYRYPEEWRRWKNQDDNIIYMKDDIIRTIVKTHDMLVDVERKLDRIGKNQSLQDDIPLPIITRPYREITDPQEITKLLMNKYEKYNVTEDTIYSCIESCKRIMKLPDNFFDKDMIEVEIIKMIKNGELQTQ